MASLNGVPQTAQRLSASEYEPMRAGSVAMLRSENYGRGPRYGQWSFRWLPGIWTMNEKTMKTVWEKHIMETRFNVKCGENAEHLIIISTAYIPDPDNPTSGKTIPAPHLEFPDHCECPDHEHCCADAKTCSGQAWIEGQLAFIKMTDTAAPSCAQFFLEFVGQAPKRIEQAWWSLIEQPKPEKVGARKK